MRDGAGRDIFAWISEIDAASLVMVVEARLAPRGTGAEAARAILAVRHAAEAGERPSDYLDVQRLLRAEGGEAADAIHIGRSRQDILATVHRLLLRDRLLALSRDVLDLRAALLVQAASGLHDPVPAYTNGVQAQPTAYGHLVLGYETALARSTERLAQAYRRVNRSPLGAAALATTSYAVDRARVAALLGFDGPEEHAFDAAQLAPADLGFDAAAAAMGLALTLSMLVQDVFAQYHHARPWLLLDDAGDLVSPSTLMPQKRNPVALGRVRLLADEVLGDGVRAALVGHNVTSGVTDYKRYDAADTLDRARRLVTELRTVVGALRFDAGAALDELGRDFATASEGAAVLAREAGIPSAQAHAVVSALVDDARARGEGSADLDADAVRQAFLGVTGAPLAVDPAAIVAAFSPSAMVEAARGLGGPQHEEVERLSAVAASRLSDDVAVWHACTAALEDADAERANALARLAEG